MSIQINTADAIAILEAKLPEAKAYDRVQLQQHRTTCKETAAARRTFLRGLIALPDAKLAELSRYDRELPDGAACPMSKVEQINKQLTWLRLDRRNSMTIDTTDHIGHLLAWSATPRPQTVCD